MKHRFRRLSRWLALASVVGAATVALAPTADAYTAGEVPTIDVVNCTAAGTGAVAPDPIDIPTLAFGTTGQAAGCWGIQADPGEAWENGDQVNIVVDDSDDANDASGPQVSFAAKPTVKLGATTIPDANITITTTTSANDTLRITVTGLSAPTFADMVISNVKYDVGFKTAPVSTAYGQVDIESATVNGVAMGVGGLTGVFLGAPSNAFLSDVSLTANDPEVGIDISAFPGTATAPISDMTIREASTAALAAETTHTLCIFIFPNAPFAPDAADFASANVSKTAGDATAVGVAVAGPNHLQITFTTPPTRTAANTFRVTGITVDPAVAGRILVGADLDGNADCLVPGGTDTPLSPRTTAAAVVDQDRTGGSDRFQTARRIAEEQIGSTDAAIIARGDDFADALAASGLAGKVAADVGDDVPILLTNTNSIPSATLNALTSLSVKTVYIVGGTQAVSQSVENQLRNKPAPGSGVFCPGSSTTECLKVVRIAGADRFATAQEIADFMGSAGTVDLDETDGLDSDDALKTAFLARGDVFADALAVGPLAYQGTNGTLCISGVFGCGNAEAMPILLTRSDTLSPAATAALIDLGIEQVVIAGGTSAVSQAVEDAVKAMGIEVVRVGGANRQNTAALVAGMALGGGFGWPSALTGGGHVILARGDNFPDALAAGPFGGSILAPIVLTENPTTLGVFTTGFFDITSAVLLRNLHLVGQTAAVSDAAATAARAALSGTTL